jgi:hypothetical protein
MSNIHIYYGTPTSGGTDGTQASEGTESSPIIIGPLDIATGEESAATKLAIRTDSGYVAAASATITPTGTTAADWALAPDNSGVAGTFGAYGAALTLSAQVTAVNTLFWVKAKALTSENPTADISVDLVIAANITAT